MRSGWNTISELSLVSNPQSQKSHAFFDESIGPQRVACASAGAISELILNPAERGMLPVLDLDPAIVPAAAVAALAVLGDHTLQPHQAGVPEQVLANLALFEVGQEYAVDAAREEPARLDLRIDSGSLRTSSPSLTRMSKA